MAATPSCPFRSDDPVDRPISLYAATKRAGELMAYNYSHLYRPAADGPAVLHGLRALGPAGHVGLFMFTKAILAGEPIKVFNNGEMRRDFTYIDDIVAGVAGGARSSAEARPATGEPPPSRSTISATTAASR